MENNEGDKAMNRCLICHRKLNDDESIKRGMGPTCYRRVMKVVKEDKARRRAKKEQKSKLHKEIPGQINLFEEKGANEKNE